MSAVIEEVARKLGGQSVLGQDVRSQADLAKAVRRRLPLIALKISRKQASPKARSNASSFPCGPAGIERTKSSPYRSRNLIA